MAGASNHRDGNQFSRSVTVYFGSTRGIHHEVFHELALVYRS
jgi:hypothetical protein